MSNYGEAPTQVGQKDIVIYINAASYEVAFLYDATFRPASDIGGLIFSYIFNIYIYQNIPYLN